MTSRRGLLAAVTRMHRWCLLQFVPHAAFTTTKTAPAGQQPTGAARARGVRARLLAIVGGVTYLRQLTARFA
jgi:hypothetical protein